MSVSSEPAAEQARHQESDSSAAPPQLAFVLSAGRTGTVFLTKALNAGLEGVHCEHEPPPARREIMLANFRNQTRLGGRLLRSMVQRARTHRLSRLPASITQVELNPMLCPLTDLLPSVTPRLCIAHIVRDPVTWVRSILSFRASGFRRHLIERTPFANPYPSPRPRGWFRMGRAERALWRWRYCNEQILALKPQCSSYRLIRHEDLFDSSRPLQEEAVRSLIAGLGLEAPADLSWFQTAKPENTSPRTARPVDLPPEDLVERICGPLLDTFGYRSP